MSGEGKKLHEEIREQVQRVWLAGLGALASAEEEGTKLFQSLVERGARYQGVLSTPLNKASEGLDKIKGTVDRAREGLGQVEEGLEERLASILARMGVPTRREINELAERVDRLTEAIEALARQRQD